MVYPQRLKEEAFALYTQGITIQKIARQLKCNRATITDWRNKDNWKKRRQKITIKAQQKVDTNLANTRAKGITIFKDTLKQYHTDLKLGTVEVKPRDAVVVHQHLLVLEGDDEMRDNVITVRWLRDDEELEED